MTQSRIENDAFDTVQRFNDCTDQAAVYDVFSKYIRNFGFDCFIISEMPPVGFQLEPHIITHNWPLEWYQHYITRKFFDHDPVARYLESTMQPHMWSEIPTSRNFTNEQRQVMNDATEFGLRDGFIIPLEGETELPGCLSMSGQHLELPPYSKDALYMVSIYAHETLLSLNSYRSNSNEDKDSLLTPREREILVWVANGKTDIEIGIICGISHRTAAEHVNNAVAKLNAVNRTQAAVKAAMSGYISI